ncbi:hypothetical protein FD755_012121 [Muntiacus reevesi]|uniref:C2H2-type domain-containing protein n=2 Tax=Muntiacus TaxID=9885 RepID=A0A5N3XPA2_MUNRE|nr:hypothetical protein FD754_020417 [Muntiacus muntjak]KAB0375478.1 hypothetical protein FD755_012121 [Muntiacus reevesi]
MTGIAAASFFSNTCRFGGCGLHFPTLADLIEHIEDNHIGKWPGGGRGECYGFTHVDAAHVSTKLRE